MALTAIHAGEHLAEELRALGYPPPNAKTRSQYPQLVLQICAAANVSYSSD